MAEVHIRMEATSASQTRNTQAGSDHLERIKPAQRLDGFMASQKISSKVETKWLSSEESGPAFDMEAALVCVLL